MPLSPTRAALVVALLAVIVFGVRVADFRAIHDRLSRRLIGGFPWGTAVIVTVLVGFYLFAQSGLSHPRDPVVYPFVSWSYSYPTGILTAGIAHGSLDHIASNVGATLVLAPIAEYVWSHYPHTGRNGSGFGPTGDFPRRVVTDGGRVEAGGSAGSRGVLSRPWVRAVVVFPTVAFAVAFVTAAFSLGPGLGFSGAVFGVLGFALVARPLATVGGVVATSALGTLFSAFTQPVVRETIATGPPAPPAWAGVGFQAHLFGFLLGVLLAVGLCATRDERPPAAHLLPAALIVGLVQSLWLVAGGGSEEFVQYRGAGVTLLIGLVIVVTVAAAGRGDPLRHTRLVPNGLRELLAGRLPSGRRVAAAWLLVVVAGTSIAAVAVVAVGEPHFIAVGGAAVLALLLSVPALPPLLPARVHDGPLSYRGGATLLLVGATLLISVPMVAFGLLVVDDPTIEGSDAVEVRDYTVAYVAEEPSPRASMVDLGGDPTTARTDGVVVASDVREIWTVAERPERLAYEGDGAVVVGGIGWRETVEVDRVAWDVTGGSEAYAVDLDHDDRTVRSYVGDPVTAAGELDGYAFAVAPTADGFAVELDRRGEPVATAAVPSPEESTTVGEFTLRTEPSKNESDDGDVLRLFVEGEHGELLLAERTD